MDSLRHVLEDDVARELSDTKVLWSAMPDPWGYARGPWEVFMLLASVALKSSCHADEKTLDFIYGRRAQECRRPEQAGKTHIHD
jgi:hypothetical protein